MIASSMSGKFTEKLDFISPKPQATPRRNLRPVEVIRVPKE